MAFRFNLGSVPGCASDIGLTWVLGAAPNAVASPQNSLLFVSNCACTSNPITISYAFVSVMIKLAKLGHFVGLPDNRYNGYWPVLRRRFIQLFCHGCTENVYPLIRGFSNLQT